MWTEPVFDPDKTFNIDAGQLILECVRLANTRTFHLDMRHRRADAEANIRRPTLVRPAILRAEEKLVQPVGELHHAEGVPNLVSGTDRDAIPYSRDADHRPLISHHLG